MDFACRRYGGFGAFAPPALHIYGNGILADVSVGPFDVHGQRRRRPAKALWPQTRLIDLIQ